MSQEHVKNTTQKNNQVGLSFFFFFTYLFGAWDVPSISQDKAAELIKVLHGSLFLLRGLKKHKALLEEVKLSYTSLDNNSDTNQHHTHTKRIHSPEVLFCMSKENLVEKK